MSICKSHQEIRNDSKELSVRDVQNDIGTHYSNFIIILMDGSKDSKKGCAGSAVYIPVTGVSIQ